MSNFNTEKFKQWQKSNPRTGEVTNYVAYQDAEKNRIALFDNADALIDSFNQNFACFGGNGTWTWNGAGGTNSSRTAKDTWAFGEDFPTYNQTSEALATGTTAAKYLNKVEEIKE